MRLTVIGEASRTKYYLIKRALDAGYSVNLLESAPPNIRKRKKLNIIIGDAHNINAIYRATESTDAALYILNNPRQTLDNTLLRAINNLVSCLEENGIQRLVLFSCIREASPAKTPKPKSIFRNLWLILIGRHSELASIADILKRSSVDWTILKHPSPINVSHDDIAETKTNPDQFRENLAKQMVSQVTDATQLRTTIESRI